MQNFQANPIIINSIKSTIGRPCKLNHVEVLEKYKSGIHINELAKYYNVTTITIRNTLKRAGVVFNSQKFDRDQLIIMYNSGISLVNIATFLNVTPPAISHALKACGIKTGSTRGKMSQYEDDIIDLWNKGFTITQIKNKLGITYTTAHTFVRSNFGQTRVIENADGTTKIVRGSVIQNPYPSILKRGIVYN